MPYAPFRVTVGCRACRAEDADGEWTATVCYLPSSLYHQYDITTDETCDRGHPVPKDATQDVVDQMERDRE